MPPHKITCPVPENQRPENEYKSLKKSVGFAWTYNNKSFIKNLTVLFTLTYITSVLLLLSSYKIDRNFHELLIYIPTLANILSILVTLRSYLGWKYVYTRLLQATVSYEESGWYDGQVWVKTSDILLKDRLIGTYELLPILKRLRVTLITTIIITICNILVWNFIIK